MKKAEYPIVIHALCDDDGGGFTALAPDLAGCRGDGDTIEAAVGDLFAAMDEWADEMKRLGREVPHPFALAERMAEDDASLRKLVDAQASLIKLQEDALNEQNASISELKQQVSALTAGISLHSLAVPLLPPTIKGKDWCGGGNSAVKVAAPKRMPIVRRSTLVAH